MQFLLYQFIIHKLIHDQFIIHKLIHASFIMIMSNIKTKTYFFRERERELPIKLPFRCYTIRLGFNFKVITHHWWSRCWSNLGQKWLGFTFISKTDKKACIYFYVALPLPYPIFKFTDDNGEIEWQISCI